MSRLADQKWGGAIRTRLLEVSTSCPNRDASDMSNCFTLDCFILLHRLLPVVVRHPVVRCRYETKFYLVFANVTPLALQCLS